MKEGMLQTIPIVASKGTLKGLLTIEDIAKSYMDVYDSHILANAETPIRNIVETLDGELLHGNLDEKVCSGKCLIAAANPDLKKMILSFWVTAMNHSFVQLKWVQNALLSVMEQWYLTRSAV